MDARLAQLESRFRGQFSVAHVRPAGFWGVEFTGVEFRPHQAGDEALPALVRVESLRVYPDLAAALRGEQVIRSVEVDNPRIVAIANAENNTLADWVSELTSPASQPVGASVGSFTASKLPNVDITGGYATLDDPSGTFPSLGVRIQSVRVRPHAAPGTADVEGEVLIEGLGAGRIAGSMGEINALTLSMPGGNDVVPLLPRSVGLSSDSSVSIGSLTVDWPLQLTVGDLHCRGLRYGSEGPDNRVVEWLSSPSLLLQFRNDGMELKAEAVESRIRAADTVVPLQLRDLLVQRHWNGESASAQFQLVDEQGDQASVRINKSPTTRETEIAVSANSYNLDAVATLVHRDGPMQFLAGQFTGTATTRWSSATKTAEVWADGRIEDAGVFVELFSHEPIYGVDVEVSTHLELQPATELVRVLKGVLTFPEIGLDVVASGTRQADRTRMNLHLQLPSRPAASILEAMPYGVAPVLHGFKLEGDFGFSGNLDFDTANLDNATADFNFDTETFRVVQFGPLAPIPDLTRADFVWQVTTYEQVSRRVGPGSEEWVPFMSVPSHVYRAIVAAEDDRFWIHNGFDEAAILSALRTNLEAGRIVKGGSTISQQVVKNLFLNHERTLVRKLQEAILTWQLEHELTKDQILELYLNLVHLGPAVYGVREAAFGYFNHPPEQLTLRESAYLASILPNPAVFGEQYTRNIISDSRREKMEHILVNLHRGGYIPDGSLRYHLRLIEQGVISLTPPPAKLGEHATAEAADEMGTLFFR